MASVSQPNLEKIIHQHESNAEVAIKEYNLVKNSCQVILCLDVSESMVPYLESGKAQEFAERFLALGHLLDIDKQLDIFLFAEKAHFLGAMDMSNVRNLINESIDIYKLGDHSNYPEIIRLIRAHYFKRDIAQKEVFSSDYPVFVLFVTNGETINIKETVEQIVESSYEPCFWQFITLGVTAKEMGKGFWAWLKKPFAEDYSFLQKLDLMKNRFVDNAGYTNVTNPSDLTDSEFYELIMDEYPYWLKQAQSNGLLNIKNQ
ncbi:MAG TPA: VWA domain-containing protein [Cyclobacteriaceae bacterium]